ncbi:MAG: ATP-binding cassette domain-containing protein [Myxococcota bacterium]
MEARKSAELRGAPEISVPGVLVGRLLEVVLGVATGEATSLDRIEAPRSGASWQEALENALDRHPLRARPTFLSALEAAGAASASTPLVTHGRSGDRGWLAILDRAPGRVRAVSASGEDRWLRLEALAEALGRNDPEEPHPWMLVEPELPALGAVKPASKDSRSLPPLRRLFGLLKPDRSDLWTVVLYAVLIGALTLATPIAVQQLVNTVAFGGLVQPVVILALLLFGVLSFAGLLSGLQAYTAEIIQRRLFVRVVMDLAERLPRVEIRSFDGRHGPELVNRIFDLFTVQKLGALLLLDGTSVLLQTAVGLLILSFYHPIMLAFSILLVGAIAVVVLVFGRGAVDTAIGESNAKYAVVHWMEELAAHPVTFRGPGGRAHAVGRADQLAAKYVRARRRHYRIVLRQFSSALVLQVLASSLLLALGGWLVVAGQLTLGQLVASELIITAIVAAVAKLGKQMESLYDLLAATDKLGVLLDLPLEREGGSPAALGSGPARVHLRDVSYGYEGRSVLSSVSEDIEAGERVAVRGANGSGKSTLTELMAGLRAPEKGFVAVDECDIRDLSLDELRAQVVRVGEAEIFSGSILDNLRVARPSLSVAEAGEVLGRVGLLDAVRALPDGLGTHLATEGSPLARGQVAALTLARALVAKPRLLLLDEALIHIETHTRKQVLDTLFAADAPWTLVAVTDSADVIERCSRVVELSDPNARAVA